MSKQITRTRVLEIVAGYDSVKQLTGVKLAYAISRNMAKLKIEQESIKEAAPKSEKLNAYKEEYSTILDAEAKKDESGKVISAGNNQVVINDLRSFKSKTTALDKKYEDILAEQKVQEKQFEEFLNEEFEFEFYQFSEENLPETITVEQIGLLSEMIKE